MVDLRLSLIVAWKGWSASAFFCLVTQDVRKVQSASVGDMKGSILGLCFFRV
jgi:hypothetical protein